MEIVELVGRDALRSAWPVMSVLRDHLTEEEYMSKTETMIRDGYRLYALCVQGKYLALAGVSVGTNLYLGRYMWVFDLVTAPEARSRGHGRKLLSHVEDLARAEGCETIALSSALTRSDAHRFYRGMGYDPSSYVFRKSFQANNGDEAAERS